MKPLVSLILLSVFLFGKTYSQSSSYYLKLGASLKMLLAEEQPQSRFISQQDNERTLSVLIELNDTINESVLLETGVRIRTKMGDIATADIRMNAIPEIANLAVIKRIELPLLFRRTDTMMKKFTTVDRVLNGDFPLDKAYNGKDIIIGIIDDGIDITHPDFYDSTGRLRILSEWNMDKQQNPPTGFYYGTEWTTDSLEFYAHKYANREVSDRKMEELFGYSFHGTPVTGLAAGNRGVAPGSKIISVALTALGDTLLRSDRIIDGIKYIYNKAKAAQKKCIINISLGIMEGGPHDGKTLVERAIDNFCEGKPDLLVCTSAGNNGNTWKHWGGFPINNDSSFCFFRLSGEGSLYFAIPKQYSNNLSISFTDSKLGSLNSPVISRDSIIAQTPYVQLADVLNSAQPIMLETKFQNGNVSSSFKFTASHYNTEYDELIVKVREYTSSPSNNFDYHLYRFIWKGQGTVHAWFPFLNLHPQFIFNNNPYPNDPTFRMSDNEYTTVIPTHAFTVLSSGAYNIRTCYVNIKKKVVNQYEKCRTTYFTSHGPTLDGRIKPDIISPGENVMSSRKRFDSFFDHDFVVDTNTVSFGGTSAASPITAGIAALIWERFPDLSRQEVINKIKSSANFDSWCATSGSYPNNIAGYGKVDAFKSLSGLMTDVNSLCNRNDTCKVALPPPIDVFGEIFEIYPNPAVNSFMIKYNLNQLHTVRLYDEAGRFVFEIFLFRNNTITIQSVNTAKLPNGIYFLKVTGPNRSFTRKIFVSNK